MCRALTLAEELEEVDSHVELFAPEHRWTRTARIFARSSIATI
jgi:hypothetical protein